MRQTHRLSAIPKVKDTESAAEYVPPGALKAWANNPRKNDSAIASVAASIQRFGFGAPILARRETGEVIAGHTRLKAAARLGLGRVPVRYLDLSADEAHALALADNKLGELADWDDDLLAGVLQGLDANGVEIGDLGFDDDELKELLNEPAVGGDVDEELGLSAPEQLQEKWKTASGQLWKITGKAGEHFILCGSSTSPIDVAKLAGNKLAQCIWTDPPYGVAYVGKTKDALTIENDKLDGEGLRAFLVEAFKAADGILEPGSAIYVAHPAGAPSLQFRLAFDDVWRFKQGLVWLKDSMVLGRSDYHYKHEPIIYGCKPAPEGSGRSGRGGDRWFGDNAQTSVFEVARPKVSEFHPTMKPIELVVAMLSNSCPPGGMVYEPFSGSGTTMLAAESIGRKCLAMEIDPKFVAVCLERMTANGCEAVLCC